MKKEPFMKKIISGLLCVIMIAACSPQKPSSGPDHNHSQSERSEREKLPPAPENPDSQVTKIAQLASSGMIQGSDFKLGDYKQSVSTGWGPADSYEVINDVTYVVYKKRNITFGFTNSKISDLRSYQTARLRLTVEQIEADLGKPVRTHRNSREQIMVYQPRDNVQLKFIIPAKSGFVDHISVVTKSNNKEDAANNEKPSYFLPIVGTSKKLSPSSWANMVKWRENAVELGKVHANVHVNGPDKKQIALTFDDGPDQINTPAIIDALEANNVKGSFFFIGKKVNQYPNIVKKAYDDGNLVLNHSFSHSDLSKLNKKEIENELIQTETAINKVIGKKPAILRPPYGESDGEVLSAALSEGYEIVLWSIDTLDWSQKERNNIIRNAVDNARNGDIILMHSDEGKHETAESVLVLIEEFKKRGFEIVDVSELLKIEAYK
jgi:peptidoglycan-N-acetylglucosamine deacetylase